VDDLTSTTGIVALAGAALALASLITAAVLARRLRGLQRNQRAILGERGTDDLVSHAARIQEGFGQLQAAVEASLARLDQRVGVTEQRLDGAIAYTALVRYDAYNEMSGRQSTTLALLDHTRTGLVLSSIHHRDQARLYAKQLLQGTSELELSPEEAEAVELALRGGVQADVPTHDDPA
jgi:hypothetical protein